MIRCHALGNWLVFFELVLYSSYELSLQPGNVQTFPVNTTCLHIKCTPVRRLVQIHINGNWIPLGNYGKSIVSGQQLRCEQYCIVSSYNNLECIFLFQKVNRYSISAPMPTVQLNQELFSHNVHHGWQKDSNPKPQQCQY